MKVPTKQGQKKFFRIAAILLVLFVLGSTLLLWRVNQHSGFQLDAYLHDMTRYRKNEISRQIEDNFRLLRAISICLEQMDLSNQHATSLLLKSISQTNGFTRIGFAAPDGSMELMNIGGMYWKKLNISGIQGFQNALLGQEAMSKTVYQPATNEYASYYTVPVWQNDSIVGVLCAVDVNSILGNLLSVPVFENQGYYSLLDEEGVVVAPTLNHKTALYTGVSVFDLTIFDQETESRIKHALQTGTEETVSYDFQDHPYFSSIVPLGINNWSVVSIVSQDALVQYYVYTTIITAVLALVACGIFLFLFLWQIRIMSRSQQELEFLAYTDSLTGLRNYIKLAQDARRILASNRDQVPYAVWSFDIKQFDTINDVLGVAAGDRVLQLVAEILGEDEAEDSFAGRIAADLFAGIRPYQRREDLDAWFNHLQARFQSHNTLASYQINLLFSVGAYCVQDFLENMTVEEMVNCATIAKKEAKVHAGSGIAYFTEEMSEKIHWRNQMETDAPAALENHKFVIYLQPKVGIQGGFRVIGGETLVRWNHPQHGLIMPGEFIPLFEKNGFIVQLDRYIFTTACQWLADYIKKGNQPLRVAVNVSRQGFYRDDIFSFYQETKEHFGIGDGLLELEFTEGVVYRDYHKFQEMVNTFQKAGFVCSIDDFGAGYSSLNVLKNLPIDVLKLDAAFFQDSIDPKREQLVVEGFLSLAHSLNIRTVAEGVETIDHVYFLQAAGCDVIQGYYFSKPLPADAFEAYVLQHADGIVVPEKQK